MVARECDSNGVPNAFWSKGTAFTVSIISVLSIVAFLLLIAWIRNKKEKAMEETKLNLMVISMITYPIGTLIVMMNFSIVRLHIHHSEHFMLPWGFILLFTGFSIAVALITGLLSRNSASADSAENNWTFFYNNPDDSHLFVEKPSGLGWTLNFAHKKAYTILALFGILIVLIFLVPVLFKL